MTTTNSNHAKTPEQHTPEPVTAQRVTAALTSLGITSETVTDPVNGQPVDGAMIQGYTCSWLLFPQHLLIRLDSDTGESIAELPEPDWYLACNSHNSQAVHSRAAVIIANDKSLHIRLDCETSIGAGLTDEQLLTVLAGQISALLNGQRALPQRNPRTAGPA
ncbi:hypothetical protein ACFPVT_06195 [Corynebacterium choanae]|uniref:YbjN domain-containing protein n=1 Tax=Corynebacterium choanae TaxID=1862358 RepID=A0A3G6JBY4_9CORY|nr:hypothetical protein [Corynebacterium choanae]AZA13664.1 hypothetical protein CCHOA_06325 [Corynebacterium choanae]